MLGVFCHVVIPCTSLPSRLFGIITRYLYILKETLHVYNVELVFNPTYPEIDQSLFEKKDWLTSEFGHLD